MSEREHYKITPIGYVRRVREIYVEILEPYRPALKQLDQFSHVIVFWWADKHDNEKGRTVMQTRPPYAGDRLTGVFACRAEYRPNPIGMTTCKLMDVDEEKGIVKIADIDAYDGTPILDLKAYFPVCDRVKDTHTDSKGRSGCRKTALG